jgi:lipid-A-disaccharide synthase
MQPVTTEKKKIFLCSGEVSGDMHGANLARRIRELAPAFEFAAIGGERMRDAGVRLVADSTTWGSVGMFESAAKAPWVYPAMRRMPALFRSENPDVFVPIDYRYFNMRAARAAHEQNIRTVYFFAPVSWFGSGPGRFAPIAQTVDLALLTLPFSHDDYRAAGANFEFIGHPIMDTAVPDMDRAEAHEFFGTDPERPVIGLMPGSRWQEVKRLLPVFQRAVQQILESVPQAQFLLFAATGPLENHIRARTANSPIRVVNRHVYDFMSISDLLILCSGTAAHEATVLGRPMIVCYKISAPTAWLARRMVDIKFIALPNIVSDEFVVPELVQEQCTPQAVAGDACALLSDPARRDTMERNLERVRARLGGTGALDRAARRVVDAALGRIPDFRSGTTDPQPSD